MENIELIYRDKNSILTLQIYSFEIFGLNSFTQAPSLFS